MATYVTLNVVFFVVALIVLKLIGGLHWNKPVGYLLVLLLLLTALFDSLIVSAGIVAYDQSQLLGVFIGAAPVEDFFYTLLVVFMVPGIWRLLEKDKT